MTTADAVTQPTPVPHRHPAALIVAATLSFVAAGLTLGALFPDYWEGRSVTLADQTGTLAQTLVFAGSLIVIGGLLLGVRASTTGAAAVAVVVLFGLQPRVADIARVSESHGPKAGTGFALATAGFAIAAVSAVLAALVCLRPRSWSLAGHARPLAVVAALFGFAAAVGYAMEPYKVQLGSRTRDVQLGILVVTRPFESNARDLWAAILVIVLLAVLPPVAISVNGRIGLGLALGLVGAVGGIAALRLGTILGTVDQRTFLDFPTRASLHLDVQGAEGTWTFVAAGGAALICTFLGLAVGAGRAARSSAPAAAPPPDIDLRAFETAPETPVVAPPPSAAPRIEPEASSEPSPEQPPREKSAPENAPPEKATHENAPHEKPVVDEPPDAPA